MATPSSIIVIGHGPVAEAVAAALAAAGGVSSWRVHHVSPKPDAHAAALPIACPVPELLTLAGRTDIPLQPPEVHHSEPARLEKFGSSYQLTLADGTILASEELILASSRWAVKLLPMLDLSLPLRPARAHQLLYPGLSLDMPRAEHLGYGTVAAWNSPEGVLLAYDGLADPAQATFRTDADPRVVAALGQWLARHVEVQDTWPEPLVTPWSLATTPDYMPVIGPWPGVGGLWLAVGYAGWGASLSLGLAGQFMMSFRGQPWPAALALCGPGRFRDGNAQPVLRPQWLVERNQPSQQPQFAANVRLVGGKTVDLRSNTEIKLVGASQPERRSTQVRTTEKAATRYGLGALGSK